ncbi:unnamed protein product [Allacma fusca]|uniref:Uncharacterized protein n=1 Tax=Allacma fusca TaxID=39272 RepID=A0A8J2KSS2_9HEXA|nr:unnamed protein product [Allacma fusca]
MGLIGQKICSALLSNPITSNWKNIHTSMLLVLSVTLTLCQARPNPVVESNNGFDTNNLLKNSLSFQQFLLNADKTSETDIISRVNQLPDSREKLLETQVETDEGSFDSRLRSGPNEELEVDVTETEKPSTFINKSVGAESTANHKKENKLQESPDVGLIVIGKRPEPDTELDDGIALPIGNTPTSGNTYVDIKASPFLVSPPVAPELFKIHNKPLSLLEELGPLF